MEPSPEPRESRLTFQDGRKKTPLEAIVQGNAMAAMPVFSDVAKKRAFMLEHMAHAFHVFARRGYSEGMAGHISVRDPEYPAKFWTNPYVSILIFIAEGRKSNSSVVLVCTLLCWNQKTWCW